MTPFGLRLPAFLLSNVIDFKQAHPGDDNGFFPQNLFDPCRTGFILDKRE